jgi:hypothetical protein
MTDDDVTATVSIDTPTASVSVPIATDPSHTDVAPPVSAAEMVAAIVPGATVSEPVKEVSEGLLQPNSPAAYENANASSLLRASRKWP